jgi:ABC-type cobalt transport system substrate-binding protein
MKAVGRPAVQNHGGRSRSAGLMLALSCALLLCFSVTAHAAPEKWQGVDETVVEKYAVEHGRPPKTHLIEPTGDVLLFAFLIAGTVGGFILGYYYRDFTKKNPGGKTDEG